MASDSNNFFDGRHLLVELSCRESTSRETLQRFLIALNRLEKLILWITSIQGVDSLATCFENLMPRKEIRLVLEQAPQWTTCISVAERRPYEQRSFAP